MATRKGVMSAAVAAWLMRNGTTQEDRTRGARELGRLGGSVSTPKKRRAVRRNGKLGGRHKDAA